MATFSPLLEQLIESLRCLPGVGMKTAQRMAFHLLEQPNRQRANNLAASIQQATSNIGQCKKCRTFSETEYCTLCTSTHRNTELLCIVETPADVVAVEQTGIYRGYYFVLMGHLSPIDGIGPKELGIDHLKTRLQDASLRELIIATNHTVEGEATAHYISELAKSLNLKISRIAHGVPLGGTLEFVDSRTLADALTGRNFL